MIRHPALGIGFVVLIQAILVGIGWVVIFNATFERIASNVEEIIIDNNRMVSQGLIDSIGELPSTYDEFDTLWSRAQSLIEEADFSAGGFACILDENGAIVCHTDLKENPSLRSVQLGDQLIVPITETNSPTTINDSGKDLTEGTVQFGVDGKHYVATQVISKGGARLLVHQPVSGLNATSSDMSSGIVFRIVLVGVPILVLTSIVGYFLIRRHSTQIQHWAEHLEDRVEERTQKLQASREGIVLALATLADYRDNETGQHIRRISEYCVILARNLQSTHDEITDEWIEQIRLASMLHDIGKVEVPDAVLRKRGKLTDQEYELIKRHPRIGADTLILVYQKIQGDPLIQMAIEICLHHHEKWDGGGYPNGLHREEIPLSARITALADVFDALVSSRVYKPAMPLQKVREIIHEGAGDHFDPQVVQCFESAFDEFVVIQKRMSENGTPNPNAV